MPFFLPFFHSLTLSFHSILLLLKISRYTNTTSRFQFRTLHSSDLKGHASGVKLTEYTNPGYGSSTEVIAYVSLVHYMVTKGHASSVKLTRYTFIRPQYFIYIQYKKACYHTGLTQLFSLSARLSPSVLIGLLLPFEAIANMQELKEGEGEDEKEDDPVKKLSVDCQISNLPKLYVRGHLRPSCQAVSN